MSNDFLEYKKVAAEAMLRLQNNLVMANLVHTNYSAEYASFGEEIQIKKPATFDARTFTSAIDPEDVEEKHVSVKLDKIFDVSVELTAKEMTLNIDDFGEQVVEGAVQALAQKIDSELTQLYADVPYVAGGGTPGNVPNAVKDVTYARKVLNDNKAPMMDRRAVWGPEAEAELLALDAFSGADKTASTQALREASLGRLFGFDNYMSQNIVEHERGTWHDQTPDVDGTNTAGATTLDVKESGTSKTIKRGDRFTIAGQDPQVYYTVLEDATTDGSEEATIKIYPALSEEASDGTDIENITADHEANLAFHKNAFALVARPMALPRGGADGYVQTIPGNIPVRVTQGYTMSSKENVISFDVLCGFKTLEPKLACRVWRQ